MHNNPPRATIDFETRSACNIKTAGSWRYSLDPTTEVLCMAYRLPWWEEGRVDLWHPAYPHLGIEEHADWDSLTDLFVWIKYDGGLVEAHGAWFERGIWINILMPRLGAPMIHWQQWRCSAAKAAAHALPRGLEDAVNALHLPVPKDMEGSKLMKRLVKPRKPKKAELKAWDIKHAGCYECGGKGKVKIKNRNHPCLFCQGAGLRSGVCIPPYPQPVYHESREEFERLWEYCKQDVRAEEALSNRLRDLSEVETHLYLMDQLINERGFGVDTEAIDIALRLIDEECVDFNRELFELTGGVVERATQRERMLNWLEENGLGLPNTQKDTLDEFLEDDHPNLEPHVKRGVELMRILGRSSTAKYVKAKEWVCPDSRIHGGLLYHGASTGRWSGQGLQPHNFVRGAIPDMETVWEIIKTEDREAIRAIPTSISEKDPYEPYGDVMKVLSEALRGIIVPTPGRRLYVADYAAIEARVLLWLADDQDALDVFRRGDDIYCFMASSIYGYPCNKKDHPDERQVGKAAILGLGYQMGTDKFIDTAAKGGVVLDRDFAAKIVDTYRTERHRVKNMWWELEYCAIEAVKDPGCVMSFNNIRYTYDEKDGFLYCILPSGRRLAYPEPEVQPRPTPWGSTRDQLSFKGIDGYSRQWRRQTTYGGMLTENVVQAVARDLMAEAMWRVEDSGVYHCVLSVHDELIAEADIDAGNVKEFENLMAALPPWAVGCPVTAEGWTGLRYKK
jgi:DNA polymerase